MGPGMGLPSVAQQRTADQLEEAGVRRHEAMRVARPSHGLEALVVAAMRAADSRMRLEFALASLARYGARD